MGYTEHDTGVYHTDQDDLENGDYFTCQGCCEIVHEDERVWVGDFAYCSVCDVEDEE